MRRSSTTLLLAIPIVLWNCSGSPEKQLETARAALAQSDYAGAAEAAKKGLSQASNEVTAWNLELVQLEANARDGQAEAVADQLDRLAEIHEDRLAPSRYIATAEQLRAAGQTAAAVEILDKGQKRFPSDADILATIEKAKSDRSNPEALEALRSLGYIQ